MALTDSLSVCVIVVAFSFLLAARPPNVILVMPEKALKLTMNDVFRAQFRNLRTNKDLPLPLEMLAGGMAGFCQGSASQLRTGSLASYRQEQACRWRAV